MKHLARILTLLLVVLAGGGIRADESRVGRVQLRDALTVTTDTIRLSDLLPVSAPDNLRTEAMAFPLGPSPHAGSVRAIRREELERLLGSFSDLWLLALPERVIVTRACRALRADEVAKAVREAANAGSFFQAAALNDTDVEIEGQVLVTREDPGLQVTRIARVRGRLRVWLVAATESRPVRFRAIVRSGDLREPIPATRPAYLVQRGKRATLLIEGPNMRVTATAVPLEAGVMGQRIRARNPETRQVVLATVVGAGCLRAEL